MVMIFLAAERWSVRLQGVEQTKHSLFSLWKELKNVCVFSHCVVFPPFVSLHCDLNANSAAGSTRPLGPRGAHCTRHCHYSLTHLWATRMISSSIYQWYQYDWPQFWYLMIRFLKFIFMWKLVVFKLWDLRLVEMMEASNWNTYLRLLCQFSVYISFWSTYHLLQFFFKNI